IVAPVLIHDRQDKVCWRTLDGNLKSFSFGLAWESIRAQRDNVPWFHVVWFSACIPRHAFHLWLAMGRKLKTQDKLKQWDVGTSVDLNLLRCPLCKSQPDSHDHLFFSCPYSSQVWLRITNLADMPSTLPMWDDIVDWLLPISKGNSVNSIVGRLILAASTYFVWQERNNRLFAKGERRVNELCEVIAGVVRLKLTTLHFKANARVDKMMAVWKIANTCTNGG
ncbi:reverse transcriptase domain, reverse transcriptase zinc-binding domain protein, partial [Tanacetum coccineum]